MSDPIPTEAYEAAGRAYCLKRFDYPREAYVSDEVRERHIAGDADDASREPWIRAAVDAVFPIVEAATRAKVAAEIRAAKPDLELKNGHPFGADEPLITLDRAARIAEGGTDG